jgi:parallel beta-helix repeat protein
MSVTFRVHATRATFVSLAVVLAFAVVALASLGGAEAAGPQPKCGETITADTILDSDLVDCPNHGIVIGADDITLDLNGHLIDGDGTTTAGCDPETEYCDIGVLNRGHDGVTVEDGSVREFLNGVWGERGSHNRLRDLSSFENAWEGIVMFRSARSRVERISASRNGLTTDRPGIALVQSDNNRITHSTLSDNGDLALFMADSDENHISHNEARGNPEGGMIIEGDRNEIVANRLIRNGGGVLITIVTKGERAVGNEVRRNEVRDPRASGIAVDRKPKRTVISRNHVVGAGRSGINVGSRSTKFTKNRAVRNDGLGIKAVEGVIDGGGNRAHGNGDKRQCVNVKCR